LACIDKKGLLLILKHGLAVWQCWHTLALKPTFENVKVSVFVDKGAARALD
jgi:hypothetical protein